jgi:hypothetical protein
MYMDPSLHLVSDQTFAELLIEEDRTLRAVLVGMLRERLTQDSGTGLRSGPARREVSRE